MSMISNFHASIRRAAVSLLGVAGVILCAYSQESAAAQSAPDAPRSAPDIAKQQLPAQDQRFQMISKSMELKSVSVRRADQTHKNMAGQPFLKEATDPLVVEVQTQQDLPREPRTGSPIIVLNGEKLVDTWAILPNTLIAFLPNQRKLKEINSVAVVWLGNEDLTLTKRPLTFKRSDISGEPLRK
jgi:hypothetical protein